MTNLVTIPLILIILLCLALFITIIVAIIQYKEKKNFKRLYKSEKEQHMCDRVRQMLIFDEHD